MLKNSLTQRPIKTDQIPDKLFSNGEKIVKQLNVRILWFLFDFFKNFF